MSSAPALPNDDRFHRRRAADDATGSHHRMYGSQRCAFVK
ncbi:hypothetical protein SUDANB15_00280 [Streptomyces sp. enrichment culture]